MCNARLAAGIALATVLLGATALLGAETAASNRPNIVFILADDLGYGDLSSYNEASKITTENIDRLAAEGIRFTDAHSPSAVCTPTRYGILTGRYSWRTRMKRGVLNGYSPSLINTKRMTVASMLKKLGYATGCVGKWHLGLGTKQKTDYSEPLRPGPNALGFEYFYGIPASLDMAPYLFVENDRPVEAPTDTIAASKRRRTGGGGFWRAGPIAPGFRHIDVLPVLAEKAVAFIERSVARAPDRPFFLYLPLSAPHTPWMPTAQFAGKTGAGEYGDFTFQVDWTVGQVLDALERTGVADNTLVIMTSDNGSNWIQADIDKYNHRANGSLRGQKADIWEGGHRIPFIARWPGRITAGSTSDQTLCLADFLATTAAIVGVDLPDDAGEDSYNMLPALLGERLEAPIRSSIVHHSVSGVFAIRQGPWKLILGRGSGGFTHPRRIEPGPGEPKGQLYNLARDPSETHNLYADRPAIVARLSALLEKQKREGRSRPLRVHRAGS